MSDPTRLLERLSERSETILRSRKNLGKPSWLLMDNAEVRAAIISEMYELAEELGIVLTIGKYTNKDPDEIDWDRVFNESADVYHFGGMGADPARLRAEAERNLGRP